jgi:DNA-directed RNA polymerase subunit RPC12/RpoP
MSSRAAKPRTCKMASKLVGVAREEYAKLSWILPGRLCFALVSTTTAIPWRKRFAQLLSEVDMQLACTCGNRIHDGTDGLSYKGYVVPDEEYFPMLDGYDVLLDRVANRGSVDEEDYMDIRRNCSARRQIYQCSKCGRIFIWDSDIQGAFSFKPEDDDINCSLLAGRPNAWRPSPSPTRPKNKS